LELHALQHLTEQQKCNIAFGYGEWNRKLGLQSTGMTEAARRVDLL